jgi:hypothetical protein
MSISRFARMAVALIAAYAVALQTILLVLMIPVAGSAAFAAQPICLSSAVGSGSAPNGHAHDCLGACLTGCCCGTTVLPTPGPAVGYRPERALPVVAALQQVPRSQLGATGAHRSRAPPLT